MRKTLLLLGALGLSVFAKAQDVEMVANSMTQVTYDSYKDVFVENSTAPSDFVAGDGFIVYSGNLNFYQYWTRSFGDTVMYSRSVSEIYISKGTEETTMGIDFNDSVQTRTDVYENEYTYPYGSYFSYPFVLNNKVYFKATAKGRGNSACTYTINEDGDTAYVADWTPWYPKVIDNTLYTIVGGDRPVCTWNGEGELDTLPNMDGVIDNSGPFVVFGKYILLDADLYEADSLKTEAVFYNMETGEHWMYDINKEVGKDGNPDDLTVAGDKVFFTGKDSAGYYNFYVSDGTPEGTYPIDAINDYFAATSSSKIGYGDSYFWNGNLYFTATDTMTVGSYGRQIYQYNLAGDSIHLFTSYMIEGEYVDALAYNYTEFDNELYFALSIDYISYLARTKGETIEIVDTLVTDVDEMVVMGGKLYFSGEMPDVNQYNDTSLIASGSELMVYTPVHTAISKVKNYEELTVYPNPSNGTVRIANAVSMNATYELYDLAGKKVRSGLVGNGTIRLNVTKGMYMLCVDDAENHMVNKIIVN